MSSLQPCYSHQLNHWQGVIQACWTQASKHNTAARHRGKKQCAGATIFGPLPCFGAKNSVTILHLFIALIISPLWACPKLIGINCSTLRWGSCDIPLLAYSIIQSIGSCDIPLLAYSITQSIGSSRATITCSSWITIQGDVKSSKRAQFPGTESGHQLAKCQLTLGQLLPKCRQSVVWLLASWWLDSKLQITQAQ